MLSKIDTQVLCIVLSIFSGITIGILFDLYRTINYYTKPSKIVIYFSDILFWLFTSIAVFIILLRADFANVQIYTIIGITIGIFIYSKLFSEYVLVFFRFIIHLLIRIQRIIFICIKIPFKMFKNFMWQMFYFIKKILAILKKRIRNLKVKNNKS